MAEPSTGFAARLRAAAAAPPWTTADPARALVDHLVRCDPIRGGPMPDLGHVGRLLGLMPDGPLREPPRGLVHHLLDTGRIDVVEDVVARGASTTIQDEQGRLPLHRAVVAKRPALAAHLIEHGADPSGRDGRGRTPFGLAATTTGIDADVGDVLFRAGIAPEPVADADWITEVAGDGTDAMVRDARSVAWALDLIRSKTAVVATSPSPRLRLLGWFTVILADPADPTEAVDVAADDAAWLVDGAGPVLADTVGLDHPWTMRILGRLGRLTGR